MHTTPLGRRAFLGATATAALTVGGPGIRSAKADETGAAFAFEVTRTDTEWREMLTQDEYVILRKGSTELPHTSPLVQEEREGIYCCKGCDLTVYTSTWKVPLDIGWVFFSHSEPRSVLTSIDGAPPDGMGNDGGPGAMMEVHCRRCSSHLGHIVFAKGKLVHCVNGGALNFRRVRV
ncbi:MAG: peptide-methionine (R)-S-oxide reductase [Pseudomonadota bacterium]